MTLLHFPWEGLAFLKRLWRIMMRASQSLPGREGKRRAAWSALLLALPLFLISCAGMDPRNVDVEVKKAPPEKKVTTLSPALIDLGKMTEIYDTPKLNIQSKDIVDNTGTSVATGAEIPRDITEMIKSTLNAIGGKVTFIPYNPGFIQNQMITGYSNFDRKLIPDVVISGGITEFDRGLETRGKNIDLGAETKPFTHAPKWVPGKTIGIDYGKDEKEAFSRITLDFNLIDFQTMAGVPRMQTVNTIKVHKAVAESELGFTLFGPTFGLKGSVKKVQGRHAAVRLLVELSMIQIIGKYLKLPYWKLLPGAKPDPVVIDGLKREFYSMDEPTRIAKIQELLILHGYDVPLSGTLDEETKTALSKAVPTFDPGAGTVDKDTYVELYTSVPFADSTLERRMLLASLAPKGPAEPPPAQPQRQAAPPQPAREQPQPAASQPAAQPEQPAAQAQPAPQAQPESRPAAKKITTGQSVKRRSLGGRMLKDDEW